MTRLRSKKRRGGNMMSDRMRPIPFPQLMDWIFREYSTRKTVFGVEKLYRAPEGKALKFSGEAGDAHRPGGGAPHPACPEHHCRLRRRSAFRAENGAGAGRGGPAGAQALHYGGGQVLQLRWSTELRVPQAMEEYIKAWFAIKLISGNLSWETRRASFQYVRRV